MRLPAVDTPVTHPQYVAPVRLRFQPRPSMLAKIIQCRTFLSGMVQYPVSGKMQKWTSSVD
jgi:hypothetical protein